MFLDVFGCFWVFMGVFGYFWVFLLFLGGVMGHCEGGFWSLKGFAARMVNFACSDGIW